MAGYWLRKRCLLGRFADYMAAGNFIMRFLSLQGFANFFVMAACILILFNMNTCGMYYPHFTPTLSPL